MEKQKFYMPASLLIKILVCLAVIAAFWVAPPVAPLTAVGMRVIGIFIGVILMLIMRHGFKSITFSAYKERLLKLFRMAADRSQLVDGRWYNQQIQYTQNDVSIIIISSRITVSKPLNKSCEEGIIRMLNRRIQIDVHLKPEEL